MLKHTGPHLQSWALTRDANMSAGKASVHLKVIVHLFVSVPVHSAFFFPPVPGLFLFSSGPAEM